MGLLEQGSRPYLGYEGLQQVRFLVISRNLRHIAKSNRPRAVRFVLSRGLFICDAPHLTTSNEKSKLFWQISYAPYSHLLKIHFLALLPSDEKSKLFWRISYAHFSHYSDNLLLTYAKYAVEQSLCLAQKSLAHLWVH